MSFAFRDLRALSPGCFALVMATGIVGVATEHIGLHGIARGLLWLNAGQYLLLWGLTLLRCWRHPRELRADLANHTRAPGFFTMIAATGVLAEQLVLQCQAWRIASGLWGFALLLWVGITYTIFTALMIKANKPPLERGISGNWLLTVVATQAIAVLSAQLAPRFSAGVQDGVTFLALGMWLCGALGYGVWITLIFHRCPFYSFSPRDLSPDYWINMGALAISTLAGSALIGEATQSEVLAALRPFLAGATVLFWAGGTWWIPLLLLLTLWRHGWQRMPLAYDPAYWSAVFPLGMYAASTFDLARVMHLDFLRPVAHTFVYLGLAAWLLTFLGMLHRLVRPQP